MLSSVIWSWVCITVFSLKLILSFLEKLPVSFMWGHMIVPWSSRCTCFSLKWNQTGLDFASQEMVVSSFSVKFVRNSSCCSECLVSLRLLQVWTMLSLSAQHSGLWLYFPFLSPVVQMSVAGHAMGLISGVLASLRCWQQKPAPLTRQDLHTRGNKRRKH